MGRWRPTFESAPPVTYLFRQLSHPYSPLLIPLWLNPSTKSPLNSTTHWGSNLQYLSLWGGVFHIKTTISSIYFLRVAYLKPDIVFFSFFLFLLLATATIPVHHHRLHHHRLRRTLSSRDFPPLFWHHPARPAEGSPCPLTSLQSSWLFLVIPSGNIRVFLPEIGINSAVKAPVNIPVSWAWPCHLSLGTASLLFSDLPSDCSCWSRGARCSERRNQTPRQEHVCTELAPFFWRESHRADSGLWVLSAL